MSGKKSLLICPFKIIWNLLMLIVRLPFRIIAAAAGLVLMAVGILISMTVIGLPLGISLVILGFLLLVRSIF